MPLPPCSAPSCLPGHALNHTASQRTKPRPAEKGSRPAPNASAAVPSAITQHAASTVRAAAGSAAERGAQAGTREVPFLQVGPPAVQYAGGAAAYVWALCGQEQSVCRLEARPPRDEIPPASLDIRPRALHPRVFAPVRGYRWWTCTRSRPPRGCVRSAALRLAWSAVRDPSWQQPAGCGERGDSSHLCRAARGVGKAAAEVADPTAQPGACQHSELESEQEVAPTMTSAAGGRKGARGLQV